jgi:hypothetical protein
MAYSRVVKQPGREADHSPHPVPRSRMELYLHSLIHLQLIKHSENFIFMLPQNYNIFPETKGKDADDELDISV